MAGQIGFRLVGGVLIVLLIAALWFDSASEKLAHQRHEYKETSAEVARMEALVAMRTRIEQGLRDSVPQYEQLRQRGINGPTLDQAADAWRNEWMGVLQAQRTGNPVVNRVPPAKKGDPTLATLELSFDAVPAQLVTLVQQVEQGDRLQRIAQLDTTVADDKDNPHLQVKMRLEARYFPPEGKAASPASRPARPMPPPGAPGNPTARNRP
jgi:hypothetical protein